MCNRCNDIWLDQRHGLPVRTFLLTSDRRLSSRFWNSRRNNSIVAELECGFQSFHGAEWSIGREISHRNLASWSIRGVKVHGSSVINQFRIRVNSRLAFDSRYREYRELRSRVLDRNTERSEFQRARWIKQNDSGLKVSFVHSRRSKAPKFHWLNPSR